ncbi:hypothetical protein GCM10011418_11490 [Sphingobacterium alkalisoli]|uniref:hypothetical protein n=1 Tax=Sphingobacterium alkalisoli TaxID=1874115 RepID=UPI00145F6A51|nr:hypothetical protein [Sphingobacterium alkalisoli]GGH12148.1 hypothetical protein GCM10011418_11490 [Sphingobacterium alkalisoli]
MTIKKYNIFLDDKLIGTTELLRPTTKGSKHNIRYMTILESKNQDDTYVLETDSTGQAIDIFEISSKIMVDIVCFRIYFPIQFFVNTEIAD